MIGLSKISCILLLLALPFSGVAQEIEEITLAEGTMSVVTTTDAVTLGSIQIEDNPVVTEELPPDPVAELLAKARAENAARADMRTAALTETECLATALYHEARGEGEHGIKAVAFVIYNRVKSNVFPTSYCDVVRQRAQFSFVADRKPDNITDWKSYATVLALAVQLVQNGGFQSMNSPVGNALFFNSFRRKGTWAYSRTTKFIATIGRHHFFR